LLLTSQLPNERGVITRRFAAKETDMMTELNLEELETVAGGDKAKAHAALEAYKVIHEIDKLLQPDTAPAVHVPMKL
jgi:hypothetical protein